MVARADGQMATPTILIGETVMVGFNRRALEELLEIQQIVQEES
jgi:hypothetical protein